MDGVVTSLRRLAYADGKEGAEVLHGPNPGEPILIREAGLQFLARPFSGQKTGLFLDQREHRIRMAQHCSGRELVNLFAYNGGFSVHAAAAGAKRVISVDVAAGALEDAKENFRVNGINPDAHPFYGRRIPLQTDELADIVISDPPS